MFNANLRPYGEYFAKAQAIATSPVVGNQTDNNPMRLDASQGGTAIRVATPKGNGSLTVAKDATVTLTVLGAKTAAGTAVTLGTAVYTNDGAASKVFGPDAVVCDFILPEAVFTYPYVKVNISGSAAPTGSVDIFPQYVSHPRRG